jgi:hypothetical protein
MNNQIAVLLLAASCVAPAADVALVKQYSSAAHVNAISGYPQVSVAGPDFKTAATVSVSAKSSNNAMPVTSSDTQRASNFSTAAVAAVVGKVVPQVAPAENAPPPSNSHIGFKESWNSAQAWATMRGNGMPFLSLQSFGNASASGAASWTARLVIGQANGLYVRFRLPSIQLRGTLEEDGPSVYQGRVRAELLVNGHSVWTSEANRVNELSKNSSDVCIGDTEKRVSLQQFGDAIGLAASQLTDALARTITLGLGQFASGQQVDVTLVVRADSQVDRICCIKSGANDPMESFCTGLVAQVKWLDEANPVSFHAGPVL